LIARSNIAEPAVDLPLGLVFGNAISLLDLADQLDSAALDAVKVIIGELAPLLLNFAAELLPIAFDSIPIHGKLTPLVCLPLAWVVFCQFADWIFWMNFPLAVGKERLTVERVPWPRPLGARKGLIAPPKQINFAAKMMRVLASAERRE
jgi:hypothetical protein